LWQHQRSDRQKSSSIKRFDDYQKSSSIKRFDDLTFENRFLMLSGAISMMQTFLLLMLLNLMLRPSISLKDSFETYQRANPNRSFLI